MVLWPVLLLLLLDQEVHKWNWVRDRWRQRWWHPLVDPVVVLGGLLACQLRHHLRAELVLAEDLSEHFLFLNLDDHVNFAGEILDDGIAGAIEVKKLLQVLERVAELALVNEGQLVELFEDASDVAVDLVNVELNLAKALLDLFVEVVDYLRVDLYVAGLHDRHLLHGLLQVLEQRVKVLLYFLYLGQLLPVALPIRLLVRRACRVGVARAFSVYFDSVDLRSLPR